MYFLKVWLHQNLLHYICALYEFVISNNYLLSRLIPNQQNHGWNKNLKKCKDVKQPNTWSGYCFIKLLKILCLLRNLHAVWFVYYIFIMNIINLFHLSQGLPTAPLCMPTLKIPIIKCVKLYMWFGRAEESSPNPRHASISKEVQTKKTLLRFIYLLYFTQDKGETSSPWHSCVNRCQWQTHPKKRNRGWG